MLPGLGEPPRRRFPVLQGLGAKNDTSIFVSRGVGTVYVPVRINCPPEVAVRRPWLRPPAALTTPAAFHTPSARQNQPDRLGIGPVFLDENARSHSGFGVSVEHRHGPLQDDRSAVEFRGHEVHRDASSP